MFFKIINDFSIKVSRVVLKKSKGVETKLASYRAITKKESLVDLNLKDGMAKRS